MEIGISTNDGSGCLAKVEPYEKDGIKYADHCMALYLTGKIEKGDALTLENKFTITDEFKNEQPGKVRVNIRIGSIYFNSPGGNLFEAMKIGKLIRERMIETAVAFDDICYSSCVMAFVGGVFRAGAGKMGIHSFYSEDFIGSGDYSKASEQYNLIADEVRTYLREMRIPVSLLDAMMAVTRKNIKILDVEEIKKYTLIGVDPVYSQVKEKSKKNFFDQFQ